MGCSESAAGSAGFPYDFLGKRTFGVCATRLWTRRWGQSHDADMNGSDKCGTSTDGVVSKLLKAHWLQAIPDRNGGAPCFRWTPVGKNRQALVRHVIAEFHLDGDDADAPARFTGECRQPPPPGMSKSSEAARGFWLACLEELGLDCNPTELHAYVLLILSGCAMPQEVLPEQSLASLDAKPRMPTYGEFRAPAGKAERAAG